MENYLLLWLLAQWVGILVYINWLASVMFQVLWVWYWVIACWTSTNRLNYLSFYFYLLIFFFYFWDGVHYFLNTCSKKWAIILLWVTMIKWTSLLKCKIMGGCLFLLCSKISLKITMSLRVKLVQIIRRTKKKWKIYKKTFFLLNLNSCTWRIIP